MNDTLHIDLDQQSLGEIAVQLPGATAVFRRHKLDFCCQGGHRLAQACAARQMDPATVRAELEALQATGAQPEPLGSASELVDHILSRYHQVHRQQLPELIRMARRVDGGRSDAAHPPGEQRAVPRVRVLRRPAQARLRAVLARRPRWPMATAPAS